MHKFLQYFFVFLWVIGFFYHLLPWTSHSWAFRTSQQCEWPFNGLFFKLHLLKHLEFVKICPFFDDVLCNLWCKATNFEITVKDEVIIHFHTWGKRVQPTSSSLGLQGTPPPSPIHVPKPWLNG
jgi:hypothetical protein